MATQTLITQFQFKRGLAEAWDRNNPILAAGEPGWTLDTHILKIGDGSTPWKELKTVGGGKAYDESEVLQELESLQKEFSLIQKETIPGIEALIESEKQRALLAESLLSQNLNNTNDSLGSIISKVEKNSTAIEAIINSDNGILKLANDYTDKAISALILESGYGIDEDTIKTKDNRMYVAKVSTDVLEQGERSLILCAGSSNI